MLTVNDYVRKPRKIILTNTLDDSECVFLDDAGKYNPTSGRLDPNGGRQGILHAMRKRRTDAIAEGLPLFASRERIAGIFPGDPIATTDQRGGEIPLIDDKFEKVIAASLTARKSRARALALEVVKEVKGRAKTDTEKAQAAKIEARALADAAGDDKAKT